MVDEPSNLGRLSDHPYFRLAVPTPDHFLPLAYLAGVASSDGQPPNVLIDGYTMGSLSMACYTVVHLLICTALTETNNITKLPNKTPLTFTTSSVVADAVRQLAEREETSQSTILRRLVRRGLEVERRDVRGDVA